ncbi:MAG TPA: bile acid:sodium symporter family protein, partial [Anaerolineae bacterium]|nr:bile acid:sodium symporter family protein [Anaerolineae bacterium]
TRFVIMALVINFLIVPAAAYALTLILPMEESLQTGLILVALAAGAPALPKLAEVAKVDTAAATGLMALLIVATILIMPIVLPLTGVEVGFWDIASGLIIMMLIPLALNLFVRARWQSIAESAQPYFAQASTYSLLLLIVLMLVLNFSSIVSLMGSGGLIASIILVIVALAAGYLLGGSDFSSKWVQSLGAGQRNIAAAIVVATMNFGDAELVMIIVFSVITMVVMVPLAGELGKRRGEAASE